MTESHFTNVKMATLGDAQKCTFTLQNTDVAYANTLRRLILTGVESVAFRSDMNDRGTSTDVSILKNSTSMTNEMLADRIGLIPIRWKTADGSPSDYVFSLQVKNTSDTTLDVTSSNITAVKLGKDGVETPVPTDSMKFFEKNILLAVLKPMRATHEPQEIAFTAKASYGIGKEHARFIPVSQCAYRYTRDTNEQKQKELMIEWAKKMNKINADEAGDVGKIDSKKLELLKKEYDTMEIDRCYLRNEKTQEANSFDFTVETLNTIDVVQVITNAIEKANELCERYTTFTRGGLANMKPSVEAPNRLEGWDFTFTVPERHVDSNTTAEKIHREHILDLLSCDHTLGNLLQTYIDENLFNQNNVTYVGYNVPHPLRNDMVLRLGINGGKELDARMTIENAAKGCVAMFTRWLADWRKATGTAHQVVNPVAATKKRAAAPKPAPKA